ncbi:hypothetical protein G7046_g594 [Stylonectria norvegica]|nr:hypothetical protein G7046_g594 [Stylonectria norvegica]
MQSRNRLNTTKPKLGEPTGKMIKINGNVDAYLATPPEGKAHKDVGILYIADIFSIYNNSKLMADQYAANGYITLIPDLFNGDKVPLPRPDDFDIFGWLQHGSNGKNPHTPDIIDPFIPIGIKALRDLGAKKIGAVGYCFGAKYLVRQHKLGIDVGYVAHPSFVTEEELGSLTIPFSIAAAEIDEIFTTEKRHKSEEILIKTGVPWQINLFSAVQHGFTVRGDLSDPKLVFAKTQAFYQAIAWYCTHLAFILVMQSSVASQVNPSSPDQRSNNRLPTVEPTPNSGHFQGLQTPPRCGTGGSAPPVHCGSREFQWARALDFASRLQKANEPTNQKHPWIRGHLNSNPSRTPPTNLESSCPNTTTTLTTYTTPHYWQLPTPHFSLVETASTAAVYRQPELQHASAAVVMAVPAADSSNALLPTPILEPANASSSTTPAQPVAEAPAIPSDEDRSSEDGSHRSVSPQRATSNSSSISEPAVEEDDDEEERLRQLVTHEYQLQQQPEDKEDGSSAQRSRSSTIKTNRSHDNIRRLSASEMQRLTSSPESLPVAAAPQRRSFDHDALALFADQREAIRQSMLQHPELRLPEPRQSTNMAVEARGGHAARDPLRRPAPAPRTLSTPPTTRTPSDSTQTTFPLFPRRYSFHPAPRPPSLHLSLDGAASLPSRTGPATAIPLQPTDPNGLRAPSPIPPLIPLPPMSLPTHLQLELAAQRPSPLYIHQSHAYDMPYESNVIKFERLKNVLLLPPYLERTLNFGALACLDAWLYNFTILPVRFFLALTVLVKWWAYVVNKEVGFLVGFVWYGLGRLWARGRRAFPVTADSDGERSRSQSRTRAISGDFVFPPNGSADLKLNGIVNGNGHVKHHPQSRTSRARSGTARHKRTKSMPSTLSAFHKADLLQGAVIICSSMALMTLDASRMYHFIRGQSAIKLYVIYNILEVGDRLLSAIGQDILECLFSTETLSRNASGRSKVLLPLGMFVLALGYCCLHSIALYYQVITLNVAVNSYSNALLTLLLSNQFVEIKSTVFKRFEKDNLFQLTCADIVERFQLWIMLFIIGMRNVVEVGGLSVPGAGTEPGFDEASGALPLHNPSILPHSFTVLPSWIMSGEVLSPFLIVIGSEMLVDSIKHAYVTKFNNIKPAFYSRILDILCKDYYTNAFMTPSLTRRLGLAVIPLSCLFIRASVQTYHMLLSTHLPTPMSQSPQTSLSEESAVPSSPAMIAALNRFDTLIRDSLGRATYGYPYGSPLNSRPWYAWTSDDGIAAVTMIVVFFIAFLVLLILKLLLGMLLLKYARNRYARMKHKEHLVSTGQRDTASYDTAGKRVGGFGHIEVGEDRQRWVHADKTEGLKGGKGPGSAPKEKKKKQVEEDYSDVFRYEMVAKRIW